MADYELKSDGKGGSRSRGGSGAQPPASMSRVQSTAFAIGLRPKTGSLKRVPTKDEKSQPFLESSESEKKKCDLQNDLIAVKKLILGSWFNVLLFVVPFGFISNYLNWDPVAVFFLNFIGMMPLASILGDSTECLAEHLGETVGGLLNATFGNAVEIVVMILALVKAKSFQNDGRDDKRDTMILVVQFSLIGSVFSNSLLVLGCSFLAHGFKEDAHFNVSATSAQVSLLMLASFVMILPGPYSSSSPHDELAVSRAAAIILLIMYTCLLIFVLFTHKDLVEGHENEAGHEKEALPFATYGLEKKHSGEHKDGTIQVGHEHEHELEKVEEAEEEEELGMSLFGSMTLLLSSTILVAILSEFLVGAIEPMSSNAGLTEAFVGMILLPIIGNAVEHITAIRMARKGKMDISLSIAIGSATQVAMFVVALAVIVGWILDIPMNLDFPYFEVQMFIYTSIIIFALVSDGSSNWLEGAMLLCLYTLIAVAVWYQKEEETT